MLSLCEPPLSRIRMPSPATIFPMQLSFKFGNCFFHASSNFTASLLAMVNNNSKSSPSVSAAANAGLAAEFCFARSFAARETGTAPRYLVEPSRAGVVVDGGVPAALDVRREEGGFDGVARELC